jgi:hypothetical protein
MATAPESVKETGVHCYRVHIERAAQGFTMCVDCRRPLYPAPKSKCRNHSVYACRECFSVEQISEFAQQRMFSRRTQ